jgi:hypothetical protein
VLPSVSDIIVIPKCLFFFFIRIIRSIYIHNVRNNNFIKPGEKKIKKPVKLRKLEKKK